MEFSRKRRWKAVSEYVRGKTILDLGCNPFDQSGLLAGKMPKSAKYFGLDLRKESYQKIKSAGAIPVICNLNKEKIPLAPNYFDTIIISETLEHTKRPYEILEQSHKLLKPKGTIIITVPNISSLNNLFDVLREKHFRKELRIKDEGFHHICGFGFCELTNCLKLVGFKIRTSRKICNNLSFLKFELPDWKIFSFSADYILVVADKKC